MKHGLLLVRTTLTIGLLSLTMPVFADGSASPATSSGGPVDGCAKGSENTGFYQRLKASYESHLAWNGPDPGAPPIKVAGGAEAPESIPPWPYATWNVGGTPAIGVENMYYSALMDALYCGADGQALKDSRFTVYGWVEPGANVSTSHTRFNYVNGSGGNFPAAYSFEPNTAQMDQVALYFERTPDEIQRDHFDWGGRLTLLYGTDYKYTFSQGVFSNQYTDSSRQYGFDPVMYYLDFWLPRIGMGTNVRVGRYISIPDIEAQLAPNNLTYSHSLLYTVDPYTQTGVVAPHAECRQSRRRRSDRSALLLPQGGRALGGDLQPGAGDLLFLRMGPGQLHQLSNRAARHRHLAHGLLERCPGPTYRFQDPLLRIRSLIHALGGRRDRAAPRIALRTFPRRGRLRQSLSDAGKGQELPGHDRRGRDSAFLTAAAARAGLLSGGRCHQQGLCVRGMQASDAARQVHEHRQQQDAHQHQHRQPPCRIQPHGTQHLVG